ncbi:MAG: DUF2382 domain-containing protein [Pontixanthobacter sp.]
MVDDRNKIVEEVRIPVVEERVTVDKVVREGRSVTVTTTPVVDEHTVSEQVARETVDVRRVPVDHVVDAVPETIVDGDTTIIPVMEERLVVRKELVLKEEIHLTRTRSTETETHNIALARTDVTIETDEAD